MSSLRLLAEILFSRPASRALLILCSCLSASLGLFAAFAQKEFVDQLLGAPMMFMGTDLHPVAWLIIGFIALLGNLALAQAVNYIGAKESLAMQRRLADQLYARVLRLHSVDLRGRSVGEIVAIYTTDIPGATVFIEQSMPQGFGILFPLVMAPWALIKLFNLPLSFVATLLGALLVVNFTLAFRQSRFFFLFKKLAADRIGLVNEWIQNIRTLRVLGLTEAYEQKIIQVRKVETTNRIRMVTNGQSMNAISSSMTFLVNVVLVLVLMRTQPEAITPGGLLALMWIVGIFLTRPFRQLPWFFTFVFDGWTSLKRLAEALSLESREPRILPAPGVLSHANPASALIIKNLELNLQGQQLLSGINLEIPEGEFAAFVGEVGSGKSLLFQSLLGETPAQFGAYVIQGQDMAGKSLSEIRRHFSFVPQEGFTMSASLFENVVFDYDQIAPPLELRQSVTRDLRLSEFDPDQERITHGLDTEIGERGVNLSGGQKQRISLARAVYASAPLLLLDDTFSALDSETENKLIQGLFATTWKNRTRLLITHRLTILPQVDRIYFMKEGRITETGTWCELRAKSAAFNEFVHSVESAAARAPEPLPSSVVTAAVTAPIASPLSSVEFANED